MATTQASSAVARDRSEDARGRGVRLDAATVLGFAIGFGLIAAAMTLGGSPDSFVDLPALLIVIGGTFGVTTMCFSLPEMLGAYKVMTKTVVRPVPDPRRAAVVMMEMAVLARAKGLLALEGALDRATDDHFARRAVSMAVDGFPGDEIENLLQRDIEAMQDRHMTSASVFRKAAEVSPAMGLIGTLIGLVQMLGNLDDPSSIGPNMAIALLTTFYGAVLSNMVFSPLAAKLERNSDDEALVARVYTLAAASIGRKENPRRLETLLNTLLPPAMRVSNFA